MVERVGQAHGFEGRAFRSRVSAGILENAEFEYKGDSEASPDMHINTIPTPLVAGFRGWYANERAIHVHRRTHGESNETLLICRCAHIFELVRISSDVYILYPANNAGSEVGDSQRVGGSV